MSEVKVNKITPTANCGTVTLGDSGDTITIPSGVTLTSAGAITNSGTITNTGTISGGTITGNIQNTVSWQTGSIKTSGFTAVAGEGYFCDTSSGAFAVTLPASPSAGNLVAIKDYSFTADTANITIDRNGSKIQGNANNFTISTEGASIFLIYVDATKGWLLVGAAKKADITEQIFFVTATGGTVTTCGDYKIHTFTGPGTFCVSCAGNAAGSDAVEYLVVAGAGGGGSGGGGAGGFRFASSSLAPLCYPAKPLSAPADLSVTATAFPITVGAGGSAGTGSPTYGGTPSGKGSNSVFSTITSTGGGTGLPWSASPPGACMPGGSGGGAAARTCATGGSGNTPPVSPPQGNDGGDTSGSPENVGGGGGGGALAEGTDSPPAAPGSPGGVGGGIPSAFGTSGSSSGGYYYFSGGGGGGGRNPGSSAGSGGTGGGGAGTRPASTAGSGTANTGGGGGGGGYTRPTNAFGSGGSGGSGIVIIRYKYQ